MEEKKLTDEEWFEQYAKNARSVEETYCEQLGCGGTADDAVEREIEFDRHLIAYVKRLQQRVSILEADNDDYKMKLAENELVSIDWHNEQVGHLEEENAELQKQVDELKAENGRLHKIIVEEMVSVKAIRAAKNCPTAMKMLAESVGCVQKDTAKEIIQWIKRNGTLQYGGYVIHDSTIEQMCKKYGVEVE